MFDWIKRLRRKPQPTSPAVTVPVALDHPVVIDRGVTYEDSGIALIPLGDGKHAVTASYRHDGFGTYRFSRSDKGRTVVIRYAINGRKFKKIAVL